MDFFFPSYLKYMNSVRVCVCPVLHLCWLATQVIDLDQEEGRERVSGREAGRNGRR